MSDSPIARLLTQELTKRFSDRGLRTGIPPQPVAVFSPACSAVGELSIYDHGDEATVYIENVTHHHVNPYDQTMSREESARWITENIVEFLDELFEDRILMWSIDKGEKGGGWMTYDGGPISDVPEGSDVFLWSHQIQVGLP